MPLKQNVPPDSSAKQSSVSARSLFQLSSCPLTSRGSPCEHWHSEHTGAGRKTESRKETLLSKRPAGTLRSSGSLSQPQALSVTLSSAGLSASSSSAVTPEQGSVPGRGSGQLRPWAQSHTWEGVRARWSHPTEQPRTFRGTAVLRHELMIKNKLIRPGGLKGLEKIPIWKCRGIISDKQAWSK